MIKANLLHQNVHSNSVKYKKDVKILNSISVYNDNLDIYGVVDCIEVYKNGENENFIIVEHKPTKPKNCEFNFDDAIQVFLQKLCVDYIFNTNSTGELYYSDTRKRVKLPFEKEYDRYLGESLRVINEIKVNMQNNTIPKINKGQKCSGCSFTDLCMPKVKLNAKVKNSIYAITKEVSE